ncbi:hypothetical protein BKA93DRAFT_828976 [Sparassis latifolia]|uniref:Argonaute linker 1 domain-containing protein n=1 Tax=Sparassis crispa TaxID=139825 RepID=A0A401GIB8_9APHY|nr:hypothetical protein SCP_0402860 [Sparassis crispa]GBE81912.1 hypothetical protein SCP_0402860 [Sparassis crispa]
MQTDHAALFSSRIVYDGRANLFVAKDIPSADYPVHMGLNPSRGHFIVRLQKSAVINPRDIENLTRPGGSTPHTSSMAINLLQLIVRQDANLRHGFPPEGRSFFLSKSAIPLPGGLQAWRGYFQSVQPVVNRLLINVDTSTAAMYSSGPLLDLAMGQL